MMGNKSTVKFDQEDKGKRKRKITAVFAIGIVLIVAIVLSKFAYNDINNMNNSKSDQDFINNSSKVYDEASMVALSGYYDKAQAMMNNQIKITMRNKYKAVIYIQQASISMNYKKYSDSYNYAKKSDSLAPTFNTARMMALAQEKIGDKKEAIKLYKIAISRVVGETEQNDLERYNCQKSIDALGNG